MYSNVQKNIRDFILQRCCLDQFSLTAPGSVGHVTVKMFMVTGQLVLVFVFDYVII